MFCLISPSASPGSSVSASCILATCAWISASGRPPVGPATSMLSALSADERKRAMSGCVTL